MGLSKNKNGKDKKLNIAIGIGIIVLIGTFVGIFLLNNGDIQLPSFPSDDLTIEYVDIDMSYELWDINDDDYATISYIDDYFYMKDRTILGECSASLEITPNIQVGICSFDIFQPSNVYFKNAKVGFFDEDDLIFCVRRHYGVVYFIDELSDIIYTLYEYEYSDWHTIIINFDLSNGRHSITIYVDGTLNLQLDLEPINPVSLSELRIWTTKITSSSDIYIRPNYLVYIPTI